MGWNTHCLFPEGSFSSIKKAMRKGEDFYQPALSNWVFSISDYKIPTHLSQHLLNQIIMDLINICRANRTRQLSLKLLCSYSTLSFAKNLYFLLDSHNTTVRQDSHYSFLLTNEQSEARRDEITCQHPAISLRHRQCWSQVSRLPASCYFCFSLGTLAPLAI
jgi:hypothetical protein